MIENTFSNAIDEAINNPYEYDLFYLLRVIARDNPQLPPLGEAFSAAEEPVQVCQSGSIAFASSSLTEVKKVNNKIKITSNVLGLLGVNGPLSTYFSEYIQQQKNEFQDDSFLAFINVFNNRLNLLFYRAWAMTNACVNLDREKDRFTQYLLSLSQTRINSNTDSQAYSYGFIHNSSQFIRQVRNAEGLQSILANYFSLPVSIEEFIGNSIQLDEQAQTRLSLTNSSLGVDAFIGNTVLLKNNKFRINIGPMSIAKYRQFLPEKVLAKELIKWVLEYIGYEYVWDVRLILDKKDVSNTALDGNHQLGQSSWLEKSAKQHKKDLIVEYNISLGSTL